MNKLTMSLLASALVLSGCSSTPTAQDTTKDQLKAEQLKNDVAQAKAEKHISNRHSASLRVGSVIFCNSHTENNPHRASLQHLEPIL